MKSIMISIQPQWVQKILNKEKTIEIRKTKPSCELPVKVYIYCTKNNGKGIGKYPFYQFCDDRLNHLNGKVVADFTLSEVDTIEICDPCVLRNGEQQDWHWFKSNACLDSEEMMSYIGYGDDHDGWGSEYAKGYAWHIDDLKIYDKPKELGEFRKRNKCHYTDYDEGCCFECCTFYDLGDCDGRCSKLERPPQSYMYVEELEEV